MTTPPAKESPTSVRYLVIGLCVLMSILLYIDRFAINPIATTIMRDLNLNKESWGRAIGWFFFAYALCQIPSGWLSDTLGARWTLALYVAGWSLATVGLGLANGLLAISAMRIVLGIMQAGAYPAAASLLKRWVPPASRARANTTVSMGGRIGNPLAQSLTPLLAAAFASLIGWQTGSWRVVLALYGALGLVWAGLFIWLYRDSPAAHPWCNDAERQIIGDNQKLAHSTAHPGRLALAVLGSPDLWLISAMGIAVNVGWVFLVTWLPVYLMSRHRAELEAVTENPEILAGGLTALVGLGGIIGCLVGGAAADRFRAIYGLKWGRRMPGLTAGYLVFGMYVVATQLNSVWLFAALMFVISFTIDYGLGASWASYQDIGGRNVATVLAFGNMCGNFGAAGFGYYIGRLANDNNWNAVFLIAGLAMALNATGWLLFDATHPVMPETAKA